MAARRDVLIAHSPRNSMRRSHRCIASRVARFETRDITRAAIRRALVALLAHFPVYRSYGVGQRVAIRIRERGGGGDAAMCAAADRPTLALLGALARAKRRHRNSAVRFQQLSAPLAAKAVEDTAYYRYGVLLSRNEVGADVRRFSATAADFHAACLDTAQAISRCDAGHRDA